MGVYESQIEDIIVSNLIGKVSIYSPFSNTIDETQASQDDNILPTRVYHYKKSLGLRTAKSFIYQLVACFWFNDALRQYFSLYRDVSQGEGIRRGKMIDESKMSKQPHTQPLQAQPAIAPP